jgi:hypothetical protein
MSGSGAWIAKNSWGTDWGDSGYFYIRYGSARIGENPAVVRGFKNYDPTEVIVHYDELGLWGVVGYGDSDDWGMIAVIPDSSGELHGVSLYSWYSTDQEVYVYDKFDGTNLSDILTGPIAHAVNNTGYYTIEFPAPVQLAPGDTVYVAVRWFNSSSTYPIPIDDSGPMETNRCFISDNGASWVASDNGNLAWGDVAIRARLRLDGAGSRGNPLPSSFRLFPNTPNPFTNTTEFRYALPVHCHVRLTVYNMLGQKVRTLVNEHQPAGLRYVGWDGSNRYDVRVSAGVYFYRLEAGHFTGTGKLILLR